MNNIKIVNNIYYSNLDGKTRAQYRIYTVFK